LHAGYERFVTRSTPSGIFISYRREDTAYPAGWLFDRLVDQYGRSQIFKDIDSIALGDDFVDVITNAVASTDVLLALIGDRWLTITDDQGSRRLDDPNDFVRLEIEAALAREVRVIPILVGGAQMPRVDELPPSLAQLTRRQALELSPSRFDFDTSRLLRVLDSTLGEVQPAPSQPEQRAPSWLRRNWRLAAAALAVAVAGAVAAVVLVGRGGGGSSSATSVSAALLRAIPARNRPCERPPDSDFWMRDIGAGEQANCTSPRFAGLTGGSLTYGLFQGAATARESMNGARQFSIAHEKTKPCGQSAVSQMRAAYPHSRGVSVCLLRPDKGFDFYWNDERSPVVGVLSFDSPTTLRAAVDAWTLVP
jgi:hypothetical protein